MKAESFHTYTFLQQKAGKNAKVTFIKELRAFIEQYLRIRGKVKPTDFVFIYQGGNSKNKPARGDHVYREFKRHAKEAGIPTTRSLHGMRHQAVTTWIEKGFHSANASYMAGHSSKKVMKKYTHLTARRLKEKMDR